MAARRRPRLNPMMRQPGGAWYQPIALRYIREAKGMSRLGLERVTGVSRGTISYLENNDRMARAQTVAKLAKGLGVDPLDLVMEPEEFET